MYHSKEWDSDSNKKPVSFVSTHIWKRERRKRRERVVCFRMTSFCYFPILYYDHCLSSLCFNDHSLSSFIHSSWTMMMKDLMMRKREKEREKMREMSEKRSDWKNQSFEPQLAFTCLLNALSFLSFSFLPFSFLFLTH